jgi:5,10-methylenetetrahydrofolate reductase
VPTKKPLLASPITTLSEGFSKSVMDLASRLLDPAQPVVFFELVPPAENNADAQERALAEAKRIKPLVHAVNLPEVRNESRASERTSKFVPRVSPRVFGKRLREEVGAEVVVNRGVVYQPNAGGWFRETYQNFGLNQIVLVGGESSKIRYPGPSVLEAAAEIRGTGLPATLGGIALPGRAQEAERIRRKAHAGLSFFTTQVLFDSNDIVWLIQRLNGLEARIFLSFAPVTTQRDIEFLRWLGADVPSDLDAYLVSGEHANSSGRAFEPSLKLAQTILMDVLDNLPPDPPPLGLNIEHINRRNFPGAVRMLERLGNLYSDLLASRRPARFV